MSIDRKQVVIGALAGIVLLSPFVTRPADAQQPPAAQRPSPATGVFINGRATTPPRLEQLRAMYGVTLPAGRYWYDVVSGLFGIWGRESAGFLSPGHDFGKVAANASAGDTRVFINGRQLNTLEAVYFIQVFGPAFGVISAQTAGRWWLDGQTGNVGLEGSPQPLANLLLALQQQAQMAARQGRGSGGGASYRYNSLNGHGAIEGRCVTFNGGSAGMFMSGCD
jgi:hypothetical protein